MFREHSSKTSDMDTIKYATFRYDTVKVENGLNSYFSRLGFYRVVFGAKHWEKIENQKHGNTFYAKFNCLDFVKSRDFS